jgi:DNA-directed RNA polymerase specialized sigma24 family protein
MGLSVPLRFRGQSNADSTSTLVTTQRARALLLRETRDREAAADLAAEVFAAVLLAAGRYAEQGESATPWVIGIARNKLLMSSAAGA